MALEPANEHSHAGDVQAHARDYSAFLKMLKWGAIVSFAIAMIVMIIISN